MREFLDELYSLNPSFHIKLDRVKRRIEINHGSVRIDFYCGTIRYLDGCKPYIYNTDSLDAAKILALFVHKCNGFEVPDLKDIAKIVSGIENMRRLEMGVSRKYEVKSYTKTERVMTSEKRYCDICEKEITNHHWHIQTWHNDWGNDSCESFEEFDTCCADCLRKVFEDFIESSDDDCNSCCIRIEHFNNSNVKGEIKYD